MSRIALITGATSGIGEEFFKLLKDDPSYDELWITGRNSAKLLELQDDRTVTIEADLSRREDIDAIVRRLYSQKPVIGLLINCAGLGYKGWVDSQDSGKISDTIDVNCEALSVMCRECIPFMEDGNSGIINIASSAGFLPQPGFAVYAASKSYVISFSRALGYELKPRRIRVTCVCPGPVMTEFISRSQDGDPNLTGIKKMTAKQPREVAIRSLKAYRRGRKLYSCGISQKMLHLATKVIPLNWILSAVKW